MKYKISGGYVVRSIMNECILVPVDASCKTGTSMISINETGKIIIDGVQKGLDEKGIAQALKAEYDITEQEAISDTEEFLDGLFCAGVLETA